MNRWKKEIFCSRCSLSPLRNSNDLRLVEMNDTGNKLLMCKDCRRWLKGRFKLVRKLKGEK